MRMKLVSAMTDRKSNLSRKDDISLAVRAPQLLGHCITGKTRQRVSVRVSRPLTKFLKDSVLFSFQLAEN